jgi:hypothetical protein
MKNLSQHITESFVTEAKSKTLQGLTFDYTGQTHEIDYTDGDFVTTTKGKEFRISTLEKNGVTMPVKEKKPASNKGEKIMSKLEYQKICKEAAKTGGAENAHDLAQSMIMNPDILARLQKDYPARNLGWHKRQLQWDIEAYA